MTSPYGLDSDHRTTLEEKILCELKREEVVKTLRAQLDDFCQRAIDQTTDYLQGEYSLILEEIVLDRANRMVLALLKGDHKTAQAFCLEKKILEWGVDAGKDFVYDPDGIRAAVVQVFQEEILTAELISLRENNKRMAEQLAWGREHGRY